VFILYSYNIIKKTTNKFMIIFVYTVFYNLTFFRNIFNYFYYIINFDYIVVLLLLFMHIHVL